MLKQWLITSKMINITHFMRNWKMPCIIWRWGHQLAVLICVYVLFLWPSRAASRAYVTVLWPLLRSFDLMVLHYFSRPALRPITVIIGTVLPKNYSGIINKISKNLANNTRKPRFKVKIFQKLEKQSHLQNSYIFFKFYYKDLS